MKLYELTENYAKVWEMLNSGDTDLQVIKDTLESIECAIEVKAENSVSLIKNLEVYSNGLDVEIKRLQAKKQANDNNVESIKTYLFSQLDLIDKSEIKTPIATIKQQSNPPAVFILDEKKIPSKYKIKVPASFTISKKDIADDLKNNVKVRGAELKQSKRWVIK